MIRALAFFALLASPAAAELPAKVASALDTCLAPGPTLQARTDALLAAGWRLSGDSDADTTAGTLAPANMIRMMMVLPDSTAADRLNALERATGGMRQEIAQAIPAAAYLVADGTGAMRIASRNPGIVDCIIAAPVAPGDVAARFGLDLQTDGDPVLTIVRMTRPGSDDAVAWVSTFTPGLFGADDPLPITETVPVAITD